MRHIGSESVTDLKDMALDDLDALCQALEEVVRGGQATLEDFGRLALAQQEVARRRTTTTLE